MKCTAKLCDKNGNYLGFIQHIYIYFILEPLQIFVPRVEIIFLLIIIFQYVYSRTMKVCANFIDIFISILGQKCRVSFFVKQFILEQYNHKKQNNINNNSAGPILGETLMDTFSMLRCAIGIFLKIGWHCWFLLLILVLLLLLLLLLTFTM